LFIVRTVNAVRQSPFHLKMRHAWKLILITTLRMLTSRISLHQCRSWLAYSWPIECLSSACLSCKIARR